MGVLDEYADALRKVPLNEAVPFGAAATPQGDPTALSNAAAAPYQMVKALMDSARQAPVGVPYEHMTPEQRQAQDNLVNHSAETALGLAGGGTPAAEAGAAGIFGGRLAKTADLGALRKAHEINDEHFLNFGTSSTPETRAQMWNETGWTHNPKDLRMRFEIPDNKSVMTLPMEFGKGVTGVKGSAAAVMRHPDLYKAYPELAGYKADIQHGPIGGEFDPNKKSIFVSVPNLVDARSVMLHELQHGVQDAEGFAQGSSIQHWMPPKTEAMGNAQMPEYVRQKVELGARDLYHQTAGEVEARNVQRRMDYLPSMRRMFTPEATQSVPFDQQVLVDLLNKK